MKIEGIKSLSWRVFFIKFMSWTVGFVVTGWTPWVIASGAKQSGVPGREFQIA